MAISSDRKNDASQKSTERSSTKAHAAASLEELRAFVSTMRGKNPQEIMGIVAGNTMARAMLMATMITILVLAVGTIVPFVAYGHKDDRPDSRKNKAKATAAKEAAAKEEAAKKNADAAADGDDKSADKKDGGGSAKEKAVKSMTKDFDEVKGTKADEAPGNVDDLLEID